MTSERAATSPEIPVTPAEGTTAATAGQMLRQARERAGLRLDGLAAVLKVPVLRLEALEADRYDQLPGAAFTRGLASSLARTLKLDVGTVLGLLPKADTVALKQDRTVAAVGPARSLPSHVGGYGSGGGKGRLTRVLIALVVVLLLAAAAIFLLPQIKQGLAGDADADDSAPASNASIALDPGAGVSSPGTGDSVTPILVPLAPLAPADTSAAAPTSGAAVPTAAAAAPVASMPASGAVAAPGAAVVPTSESSMIAAMSAPAVMATPTTGTVVFNASGESWVEVLDGNRLPLLRRTLQAGEKVGVSGAEPLSVTVGSSRNVHVEVRGQSFSLAAHQRGNVARFQVK